MDGNGGNTLMLHLPLKEHVINELTKHLYGTFGEENPELCKAFDFENRFRVIADTEMFNAKGDEYLWKQDRGDIATVFQVYFDGEFMVSFDEDTDFRVLLPNFFKAFKDKYSRGLIHLIKEQYKIDYEVKKMEEEDLVSKVKKIKATTPNEKMAKEVLLNVAKDQNKT